jgi:hypothetical protein
VFGQAYLFWDVTGTVATITPNQPLGLNGETSIDVDMWEQDTRDHLIIPAANPTARVTVHIDESPSLPPAGWPGTSGAVQPITSTPRLYVPTLSP